MEPEKSLGGTELNCCSIKAHSTLYCIHFRLGEAVVGLRGFRSGRGGSSPARPTVGSVPDASLVIPSVIFLWMDVHVSLYFDK
jgi:hypothetical protein